MVRRSFQQGSMVRRVTVGFRARVGADDFEDALSHAAVRSNLKSLVTFDLSSVEFATLEVLVSLATVCNLLACAGASVTLLWDYQQSSYKYAERIGFFSQLD